MKEGSQVVVLGKLDDKIRNQSSDQIVKGTVYCLLRMEEFEIAVMLETGDIWVGKRRDVKLAGEQE